MDVVYSFAFNDQLPTTNQVVSQIISVSPGGSPSNETKVRKNVVHKYATQLEVLWQKAFSKENVLSINAIKTKIRKELLVYYREVITYKGGNKRQAQKAWREKTFALLDIKKPSSDPTEYDIAEQLFYEDQQNKRKMYLSEEIDIEFERERGKEADLKQPGVIYDNDEIEIETLMDTSNILNSTITSDRSLNRSGYVRLPTNDIIKKSVAVQVNIVCNERPEIRKSRNCSEDVKVACANVSTMCGISAEKARVAIKATANALYHHNFYLSKDEQINVEAEYTMCLPKIDEPQNKRIKVS